MRPAELEHPVFIESGRFTDTETRYTVGEKEFLAIVRAFEIVRFEAKVDRVS
jgi:hypothetical protein